MRSMQVSYRTTPHPATEKPSFEVFYNDYYSGVYYYALKKLNNPHDAEDLVSEAFLYCFDHYADYDPSKSSPGTWLYLVVNSRIKNRYRDRRETVDLSLLESVLEEDTPEPERGAYLEQLRETLASALKTLPERQREIVIRRYFKERSNNEIALELGLTPGNVRVLLSRALDKLEIECKAFLE